MDISLYNFPAHNFFMENCNENLNSNSLSVLQNIVNSRVLEIYIKTIQYLYDSKFVDLALK